MTTEQNQPESAAGPSQVSGPQAQGQAQGQGGHRRRRRRRKGNKPAGQANGQTAQPTQQNTQPPPGQKQKKSSQNRFFQKNQGNPGNGNGGGGGARRRNKPRRQQVFVGPMDHSYRAVNGNIADGPPSTIDLRHSSGANGNGNGNGYYGEAPAAYEAAPPTVVREDAPTRIYCFIDDLFFLAKINETARKLGVKVAFVKNDKEVMATLTTKNEDARPSLIVFDLNNANAKPMTLIPKIRAKLKKGTSIIGFLSHLQGDLKVKAIEAGCDMVMPRSAFSQNLPNLLRRHGLDDESEALEA